MYGSTPLHMQGFHNAISSLYVLICLHMYVCMYMYALRSQQNAVAAFGGGVNLSVAK